MKQLVSSLALAAWMAALACGNDEPEPQPVVQDGGVTHDAAVTLPRQDAGRPYYCSELFTFRGRYSTMQFCRTYGRNGPIRIPEARNECEPPLHACTSEEFEARNDDVWPTFEMVATLDDGDNCFAVHRRDHENAHFSSDGVRPNIPSSCSSTASVDGTWGRQGITPCSNFEIDCGVICCD